MNEGEQVSPALTAHRSGPRWRFRMPLVLAALMGAVCVSGLGSAIGAGERPALVVVIAPVLALSQLVSAAQEVGTVTISSEGMSWRGLGWTRSRPWSDFAEIGLPGPRVGASLGAVVARPAPGAPPPSTITFPQRLRLGGRRAQTLALLVPLTEPSYDPTWDVPDQQLVDAVRAHAGDRWTEDLRPAV